MQKNQLKLLFKECFPNDSDQYIDYFFNNKYNKDNAICVYSGDRLAAALHIIEKNMVIRGNTTRLPFIVGAATFKEFQRQGYMSRLLSKVFEKLNAEGVPYVSLNPFDHAFYRKFGFQTYTKVNKPNFEKLNGKKLERTDAQKLLDIYNKTTKNCDCYIIRTIDSVEKLIDEWNSDGACVAFFEDSYVVYGKDLNDIEEYCIFDRPSEEFNMLRITNVLSAFNSAYAAKDGRFVLSVTDEFLAANNQTLEIDIANKKVTAVIANKKPDFSLTQSQAVILLSGTESSDSQIEKLRQYFPLQKNFALDKY